MENRKLLYSILVVILAIIVVVLFWKNTFLLALSLLILGFLKHRFIPIKLEFLWFVISAIVGTVGESLIMLSGPWAYASVNILNFPLWLPVLWGIAGITGISLYQSISKSDIICYE